MVKREQTARDDALQGLTYIEGHLQAIRQEGRDAVIVAELEQLFDLSRGRASLRPRAASCGP